MPPQNTVKHHLTTAIKAADLTTVSARQIRRTVETELGLAEGELSSETWKGVVKGWIQEAMAAIERGDTGEGDAGDGDAGEDEQIGWVGWRRG